MPEQLEKGLFKELSQIIKAPETLKNLQDRLSQATKTTTMLANATVRNIWITRRDEALQEEFNKLRGAHKFVTSKSEYQNNLTAFFIKLSCENKFIAYRMIDILKFNGRLLKTSFAQCLLSLKDKTNPAGQLACPGVTESSKEVLDELKRMASKKDPDNKIKPTFKCETGVSD